MFKFGLYLNIAVQNVSYGGCLYKSSWRMGIQILRLYVRTFRYETQNLRTLQRHYQKIILEWYLRLSWICIGSLEH